MKKHWHSLTPGLIKTLVKFRKEVLNKRLAQFNRVNPARDMNLSTNEYNNFQKLRYFGLVAKCKTDSGEHESGYWLLTRNGNKFCKGLIQMPKKVQTFRNRLVDKSSERVDVKDVLKSETLPYFEKDFDFDLADVMDVDVLPKHMDEETVQLFLSF